ncbi:flagellar hook-basal body complex protein [Niveispirillum fermenti]|uniref:flagellar hook-basal body complex protein n=1 Tax=Niveispirillum fermenti TaxID=1233113 RepID=UPI003A882D77
MSIFGSLTTGISGLQAQASALGHISDNIANSRTTGYKRVDTSFSNLVLQSNSRVHNPGGVVARPSYANNVAGNIETVDRTTNLAIRGQGFFSVSRLTTVNGVSTPTDGRFYTRDGSFELNDQRTLVNNSGYALNGYIYNEATGAYSTTVSPIQVTADIDSPVATRSIELRANLPTTPTPGQAIQPTTIQVFDATGTPRDITLGWRPGQTEGSWRLTIDTPGAVGSQPLAGSLPGYPVSSQSTSMTQGTQPRQQIEEVQFTSPSGNGAFKVGDAYQVTVNGVNFTETITTNNASQLSNLAGVAQSLADKINGAVPPVGVTATVSNGRLRISSSTAGQGFDLTTAVTNATPTTNTVNPPVTTTATASQPQQSVVTFAGSSIDIGDVFTINVDNASSRTYRVEVTAANIGQLRDLNGVVTALAAQINANSAGERVVASVTGNSLTLRGTTLGEPFSVGEQLGMTTTANATGVQQVTELSYPDRTPVAGDTFSMTIGGTVYSHTLTAADIAALPANPSMSDALTLVAPPAPGVTLLQDGGGTAPPVNVSASGNRLILTAPVAGTGFSVTARDNLMQPAITNALPADNTTFVSSVQGNISGSRQTQRISITGVPGDVGATYSVTLRSPTAIQTNPVAMRGTTTQQPTATLPQITQIGYPNRAPVANEVYSVTVNGTTYSHTLTAADIAGPPALATMNDTLNFVAGQLGLPAGITASATGNNLILTSTPNNSFTVTGTDAIATTTDAASQFFDFSNTTAAPTVGNRYAITMNGTTYAMQISEQNLADFPTVASVLDNLVTRVGNDFGAPFTANAVKTNGVTTGITLTAKDASIPLDGTQAIPESFNRTITYTTTGSEVSLDEIAANLALKVNQDSGVPVQATSVGGVLTFTSNQDGIAFLGEPSSTAGTTPAHITLGFGGTLPNGELAKAGTLSSLSSANVGLGNATVSAVTEAGQPAQVTFLVDYGNGPQRMTLDLGTFGEATGLTQYDGSTINVTSLLQDGSPQGTFRDVEIRDNGDVVANYDNGRRRIIAQVPLVLFNDPNSLSRETGGVFTETSESGRARFTSTGINGAGTIATSSLEGSNVDIAQEFTKLIVAQRSYTANTRVITTTDEMLTETINLKR